MSVEELGSFRGVPYVRIGDGPTAIVAISGGDAFVRRFDPESARRAARRIAALFPPTSSVYVVGYDSAFRGDADALVASITEFIRTQIGRAVLAGVSFGGLVAMRVAEAAPDVVSGVVLISSGSRFSDEGYARVEQQIADLERGDAVAMAKPFVTLFRRRWLNVVGGVMFRLRRRRIAATMNDAPAIVHMLRIALTLSNATPTVPQIPVAIFIGDRDQFFDVDAAKQLTPHVASFAGETHMLAIESKSAVRSAIDAFLESQQRRLD